MAELPTLVSIDDTLKRIPVSRKMLYDLFAAGDLTRVKVGSRAFIPESSIQSYIEKLISRAAAAAEGAAAAAGEAAHRREQDGAVARASSEGD